MRHKLKLQQYYIYKFLSSRLKHKKFNIDITIDKARINGEIVSLGDSQMLRSWRKIKGIETGQENINSLFLERKRIKNQKSSLENIQKIIELNNTIDNLLFIPDIVSVVIEDKRDYKKIIDNNLVINGKTFVRFMASSGQIRRNTVLFINKEIEKEIKTVLNNDRDLETQINSGKYNAYFSLSSSATYPVSEPYFCVIPDCEVIRKEIVDFVIDNNLDGDIIEQEKDVTFNIFDGMGLISPKQAKLWADELGLDFIPSTFIVRNAFLKGMVAVFDFHRFSDEIGEHFIKDVWGNKVNVRDMDLIITQSMLKLWNAYKSIDDYIKKSKNNEMVWGISRWSKKTEDKYVFTNYQFLQVLDLNKKDIEDLCKDTVDYINKILGGDINYTLLYLMGKSSFEYDENIVDNIQDVVTRALMLNPRLIDDPYIYNFLARSLNKTIKESYLGKLLIDGFYTMMVSDPYALCEYAFGLQPNGLLKRDEHYCKTWIDRGSNKIAGLRAPLTWKTEVNIMNLKNTEKMNDWYQFLGNSVIYNVHGLDCMLHGGAD